MTPARDALGRAMDEEFDLLFVLANPDLVVAALIESGWRPDDDHLKAMGGVNSTEAPECVAWPTDLSTCAYYRRHESGADPTGTCSFGCREEPECQTCEPSGGWPRLRGGDPEPWRWVVDMPPGLGVERVWAFPRTEEATDE